MTTNQDHSQPSTRDLYSAVPISPNSRCIRLLELKTAQSPTNPGDALEGELKVVDLDTYPDFISLSYEWRLGADSQKAEDWPTISISMSSCRKTIPDATANLVNSDSVRSPEPQHANVRITLNCHSALSHIRRRFRANNTSGSSRVLMWIDAICINQDDPREKEHQIPLMCDIYSRARSVYVWLGDGNDETNRAMRRLRKLGRLGRRFKLDMVRLDVQCQGGDADNNEERHVVERTHWRQCWEDILTRLSWSPTWARKVDLDVVLRRSWLFRSWTLQETILAPDILLVCGDEATPWSDVVSAMLCPPQQGHIFAMPQSVSDATLNHWEPMIHLWLRLPRMQRDGRIMTVIERLQRIHSSAQGSIAKGLWSFFLASSFCLSAGLLWVHMIFTNAIQERLGMGGEWYAWGWIVSLMYLSFAMNFILTWKKIVLGIEQSWITASSNNPNELLSDSQSIDPPKLIDPIRAALTTRHCIDPHDKCISLYGILDAFGIAHPPPDYSVPINGLYETFLETLLMWDARALSLLLDAGNITIPGTENHRSTNDNMPPMPSWLPRWNLGPGTSHWLTAQCRTCKTVEPKYRLSQCPSDLQPFQMDKNLLTVRGTSLGSITYKTNISPTPNKTTTAVPIEPSSAAQRRSLSTRQIRGLTAYIAHAFVVIRSSKRSVICKYPECAIFAVLEGLARREKPTTKQVYNGQNGGTRTETLPLHEAPYDFTKQKKDFSNVRHMVKLILSQPKLKTPYGAGRDSVEGSGDTSCADHGSKNQDDDGHTDSDDDNDDESKVAVDLLHKSWPWRSSYAEYLERVLNLMEKDKRGLFVVSSEYSGAHLGSGPVSAQVGDEVFILRGIPCPMILRQVGAQDVGESGSAMNGEVVCRKWKIIGAALVEGRMFERQQVAEHDDMITLC